jgi:hypothetical protein
MGLHELPMTSVPLDENDVPAPDPNKLFTVEQVRAAVEAAIASLPNPS